MNILKWYIIKNYNNLAHVMENWLLNLLVLHVFDPNFETCNCDALHIFGFCNFCYKSLRDNLFKQQIERGDFNLPFYKSLKDRCECAHEEYHRALSYAVSCEGSTDNLVRDTKINNNIDHLVLDITISADMNETLKNGNLKWLMMLFSLEEFKPLLLENLHASIENKDEAHVIQTRDNLFAFVELVGRQLVNLFESELSLKEMTRTERKDYGTILSLFGVPKKPLRDEEDDDEEEEEDDDEEEEEDDEEDDEEEEEEDDEEEDEDDEEDNIAPALAPALALAIAPAPAPDHSARVSVLNGEIRDAESLLADLTKQVQDAQSRVDELRRQQAQLQEKA
jgi:hypothetical protein